MKQNKKDWISIQAILGLIAVAFGILLLIPFAFAYPNNEQLVAFYRFEDNNTPLIANDYSDFNNDGIINGAVYSTSKGTNNTGNFSLLFDGNDYVKVILSKSLNISGEGISIGAWVYPSVSVDKDIVIKTNSYTLKVDKIPPLKVRGSIFSGTTEYTATSTNELILNDWNFIVMTFRNSYVYTYLNGIQDGQSLQCAFCKIDTNINNITIGGLTYFDGKIDEVFIYNRSLSGSEILDIYNNGVIDVFPPIITITNPDITYNETYNVSVWINFTTNELANCNVNNTLWINQTPKSGINFAFLETTAPNGFYSINISCIDTVNNENSEIVYFTIDKIQPDINSVSPKEDNTTIAFNTDYLIVDITYSDDIDLYYYEYNITSSNNTVIFSDSDLISGTEYHLEDKIDLLGWQRGTYTFITSVADSHTVKILKEANDIEILSDRLGYTFDDTNILITSLSGFESNIINKKLQDRYIFSFEYSKLLSEKIFLLYSNKEIDYLEHSNFKGHFVINKEFWIDFEQSGDVEINKITDNSYQITVKNPNSKISFNSVGALNWNTETYIFEVIYFTEPSISERLAFTNQILFFTLFLGVWCFLIFCSMRWDIPALLFMGGLFGILISIVFIQTMAVEPLFKNMMLVFIFINILMMAIAGFIKQNL